MRIPVHFPKSHPRPLPVAVVFDEILSALWGQEDHLLATYPTPVEPLPPNVVSLADYRGRRHKQKEQ